MTIKNSLNYIHGSIKTASPRRKLVIGSFFIVTLIGFLSMKALTTSDKLINWAPPETDFYLHVKVEESEKLWQKISDLEPFVRQETILGAIIPPDTKEIAIIAVDENFGIVINSNNRPAEIEGTIIETLDKNLFLIKEPEFPTLKENQAYTIAEQKNFTDEPIDANGYLYISGDYSRQLLPTSIINNDDSINLSQAWSLHEKEEVILWKNANPKLFTPHKDLLSHRLPQNTLFWTHGTNWQAAIEKSFSNLPQTLDKLVSASKRLSLEIKTTNTPSNSFAPLFSYPFDLIITESEENKTAYVLKIEKTSNNDNQIWLKNFENYWLNKVKKTLPAYTTIILPDGSRAVEITANEALSWEEQNIANNIIHWLKGANNEFLIGYYESQDSIYFSNNYSNLVDFLYSESQKGWIELDSEAKKCNFTLNELSSYSANKENYTKISQIINTLGPYLINTGSDICHI